MDIAVVTGASGGIGAAGSRMSFMSSGTYHAAVAAMTSA